MAHQINLFPPAPELKPVVKQPIEKQSPLTREKTQHVFMANKPAAAQHGGNSDEELANDMSGMVAFERESQIPVELMTIPCSDKNGGIKNIKGSELILIVHDTIQIMYQKVITRASQNKQNPYQHTIPSSCIKIPETKENQLHIYESSDWIATLGGWKGMMPSEEVKDYFFWSPEKGRRFPRVEVFLNGVSFSIVNERLHITEGFLICEYDVTTSSAKNPQTGKWEDTKKTDLSYAQIVRAIGYMKSKFELTDSDIATIQLYSLNINQKLPLEHWKKTPKEDQYQIFRFLDYLNCLMFGMEASGLNAAIIISLMTLDLIKDGHLDYAIAFKANKDGGTYPYSNFGNNKGTYSNRENILLHRKEKREPKSMKEFRETPSPSPVAVKEAMLVKEWLRVNQVYNGGNQFETQIEEIQKSVEDILCCYLCPWEQRVWFLKKFEEQRKQFGDGLP